jgi:hypothetical protein
MRNDVDQVFTQATGRPAIDGTLYELEGIVYLRKVGTWRELGPSWEEGDHPTIILNQLTTVTVKPRTAALYFLSAHLPQKPSEDVEDMLGFLQDVLMGSFKTSKDPCQGLVDHGLGTYRTEDIGPVIEQLESDTPYVNVKLTSGEFVSLNRKVSSSIKVSKLHEKPDSQN